MSVEISEIRSFEYLFLLFFSNVFAAVKKCPQDWVLNGIYCFFYYSTPVSRTKALKYCQDTSSDAGLAIAADIAQVTHLVGLCGNSLCCF